MKDRGRKLWSYIRGHLTGIGIGTVAVAMVLTVAKGVSGQETGFDPGEIDTSFSSAFSGIPDRTGYDLSGEGEDREEVNHDIDGELDEKEHDEEPEKEEAEEENENPGLDDSGSQREYDQEQVILPEGMADEVRPLDTIDAGVNPEGDGNGNVLGTDTGRHGGTGSSSGGSSSDSGGSHWQRPPVNEPGGGSGENPGGTGTGTPPDGEGGSGNGGASGGNEGQPGGSEENPPAGGDQGENSVSVVIGGENHVFDNEDDALAWIADNKGTNDEGQYFEGFVKDENGNLVPSYTDKENFGGSSDGNTVWDYTGSSETFVVPEGTPNLELAWISNNDKIKTIVIPKTVNKIIAGEGSSFSSLEKFVVSADNPQYVGVDGVLYRRTETGDIMLCMVPRAKNKITDWPDNLTVIGQSSFYGTTMEYVEFPESVVQIEDSVFDKADIGTIVLPSHIGTIGAFAFMYRNPAEDEAPSWHRIRMKAPEPSGVVNTTFYWMDYNLENKKGDPTTEIIIPSSPMDTVYEAYLKSWGMALVKRYGGENTLKILKTEDEAQKRFEYFEIKGKGGFKRAGEEKPPLLTDSLGTYDVDEEGNLILVKCTSTSSMIDLSDSGITSVREGAFDGCSSMTVITLPESLEAMPENIFARNENLKVILSYAPEPPVTVPGVPETCAVCVRPGALSSYQTQWGGLVRKILATSEAYTATSAGLVLDTKGTRLIDIPADMTNILFPNEVTSIYDRAAAGHTALTQLAIPARINNVGEGAFAGCTNLAKVSWETDASVPDSCFEGCMQMTSFAASGKGHNLTSIGNRAFYDCGLLTTVLYYSYPSGGIDYYYYYYLDEIGEEAFYGCTSMTYAYLHSSVTEVGAGAFEGSALTRVYWYTAAPVPESCFADCTALSTVGWGNGLVTAIGSQAFYGCTALTDLQIPSEVNDIEEQAFDAREGNKLTLTFAAATPSNWEGPELIEDFELYVPDSQKENDRIYRAYLKAWQEWLGEYPGEILKTKDKAEERVSLADIEEDPDEIWIINDLFPEEPELEEPEPTESEPEDTGPEEEKPEGVPDPSIPAEKDPEEITPGEEDTDDKKPEEIIPEGEDTDTEKPEETAPEGEDTDTEKPEETAPEGEDADTEKPEEAAPEGENADTEKPEEITPGETDSDPKKTEENNQKTEEQEEANQRRQERQKTEPTKNKADPH